MSNELIIDLNSEFWQCYSCAAINTDPETCVKCGYGICPWFFDESNESSYNYNCTKMGLTYCKGHLDFKNKQYGNKEIHKWCFDENYNMTRLIINCRLSNVASIEFTALNATLSDLNHILFTWLNYFRNGKQSRRYELNYILYEKESKYFKMSENVINADTIMLAPSKDINNPECVTWGYNNDFRVMWQVKEKCRFKFGNVIPCPGMAQSQLQQTQKQDLKQLSDNNNQNYTQCSGDNALRSMKSNENQTHLCKDSNSIIENEKNNSQSKPKLNNNSNNDDCWYELNNNIKCKYLLDAIKMDPQSKYYNKNENRFDFDRQCDVLNHLSFFQHSPNSMPPPMCHNQEKCESYQRLVNDGNNIEDRIHLYLYTHPIRINRFHHDNDNVRNKRKLPFHNINNNSDKNDQKETTNKENENGNGNGKEKENEKGKEKHEQNMGQFTYTTYFNEQENRIDLFKKYHLTGAKCKHSRQGYLLLLVFEVIANGFESDLQPTNESNNNNNNNNNSQLTAKKRVNQLLNIENKSQNIKENEDNKHFFMNNKQFILEIAQWTNEQIESKLIEFEKKYDIFKRLYSKYKHPRHKQMGKPLWLCDLLSIILYTSCKCNGTCSNAFRNGDIVQWIVLDCCLGDAIKRLSNHESHFQNIYCGLCTVTFDWDKHLNNVKLLNKENGNKHEKGNGEIVNANRICLDCYTSFTTDMEAAKEFSGFNGMVIGLNIHNLRNGKSKNVDFFACDVSWISKFPSEKEVLVRRGCWLPVCKQNILFDQKENCQFMMCDNDSTFDTLFGITNAARITP